MKSCVLAPAMLISADLDTYTQLGDIANCVLAKPSTLKEFGEQVEDLLAMLRKLLGSTCLVRDFIVRMTLLGTF